MRKPGKIGLQTWARVLVQYPEPDWVPASPPCNTHLARALGQVWRASTSKKPVPRLAGAGGARPCYETEAASVRRYRVRCRRALLLGRTSLRGVHAANASRAIPFL